MIPLVRSVKCDKDYSIIGSVVDVIPLKMEFLAYPSLVPT